MNITNIQKKCGDSNFSLLVDLKKNIYKFTKFILNYNVEGCKPDDNVIQNNNNNENKGAPDIIKYGIPMGILASGLVGTPFLLGALGGNHNKNLKIKSRKMKKMRKRIKRKSKK